MKFCNEIDTSNPAQLRANIYVGGCTSMQTTAGEQQTNYL
jgi:hypothetical protein